MLFKRKRNRIKPLYKKFLWLKENIQNRVKILKFKKKKWTYLITQYLKSLKRYNKFKLKDQTRFIVTKYSNKNNAYKKKFKQSLISRKKFKLYYGNISNKLLKKNINCAFKIVKNKIVNLNNKFLELFETRLDIVLFRAKFSKSVRNSKQLISHGNVLVNNSIIKYPSYSLKTGDLISINKHSVRLVEKNLKYFIKNKMENRISLWPLPPKHLIINYKTMEIVINKLQPTNFESEYLFNLNLEKILLNKYF